ncbi:MAG: hypothetical protein QW392_09900 [Candidatus Jordarchaeales archaeon]
MKNSQGRFNIVEKGFDVQWLQPVRRRGRFLKQAVDRDDFGGLLTCESFP